VGNLGFCLGVVWGLAFGCVFQIPVKLIPKIYRARLVRLQTDEFRV
jgi:hypothetical protein